MVRNATDAERKSAVAFLRALDVFTDMRNAIPTQYVRAFMLIALDEGKTVGEYASKSGVSKSVMSRHILDLSDGSRRHGGEGLGLVVNKLNLLNRREHNVFLTEKGKATFGRLMRCMEY